MHSIVFYSPIEDHRLPSNDPDILFLTNPEDLPRGISTSNHPQPIVCLCCPDPLTIINTLQQTNVLIYLCTFHSGRVNLDNVREDVKFDAEGDWKCKIVLNRMQQTGLNGNQGSLTADRPLLRQIVEQSIFNPNPQLAVENQNPSPGTPNRDLQSEEPEETRD